MLQKAPTHLQSSYALAIDPGNQRSGYIIGRRDKTIVGGVSVAEFSAEIDNRVLRDQLGDMVRKYGIDVLIIETPKPRGLPTAADEMETLVEVGRFIQKAEQLGLAWSFAFRTDIKVHITGRSNTGDSHVRQALLDRFGGEAVAIGGKRCKT